MSLIASFRKSRCRSSYGKTSARDDKTKLLISKDDSNKSKPNLPNIGFSDISKDTFEYDSRGRDQQVIKQEPMRIEEIPNQPFLLGSLPFRVDQKLIQKLRLFGFKLSQDCIEVHPHTYVDPLKEVLRIQSVNIKSYSESKKIKPKADKVIAVHVKNPQNVHKKGVNPNDLSFEHQSPNMDERDEVERQDKEKEALKKTLFGNNSNNVGYQIGGYNIIGSKDKLKDIRFHPSYHRQYSGSPLRTSKRDGYSQPMQFENKDSLDKYDEETENSSALRMSEPDQWPIRERKRVSLKGTGYVNQRFGPLGQIVEMSKKKEVQIPNITIVGNGVKNQGCDNGSSYTPSKVVKQNEEDNVVIIPVQPVKKTPINVSSSREYTPTRVLGSRAIGTQAARIRRINQPSEFGKSIEISETFTVNKQSAPTTPTPVVWGEGHANAGNSQLTANPSFGNLVPSLGNSSTTQGTNSTATTNNGGPQIINNNFGGVTGTKLVSCKSPPKITSNNVQQQKVTTQQAKGGRSQSLVTNLKPKGNANGQNTTGNTHNTIFFHNPPPVSKSTVTQNKVPQTVSKAEEISRKKMPNINQVSVYKYFVGKGNNANLVKRVLKSRGWWEETPIYDQFFNLKWQQTSRGYKFERLIANPNWRQLVNHFEFHSEITTKNGLVRSLASYCDTNKIQLFDLTPTTFVFNMDDEINFDTDMQRFAQFFIKNHPDESRYPKPDPNDKKNADVWYNFEYRRRGKYQAPNLSVEKTNSPYLKPKLTKTLSRGATLWVLKPTGLNRGRGIEVFNSLEGLDEMMNQYFSRVPYLRQKPKEEEGSGSEEEEEEDETQKRGRLVEKCNLISAGRVIKSRTFVIQKYIENLFVVNNRKFDIRVWALVTHDMQVYFFKEGYLRTCSEEYSVDDKKILDKYVHLTNNAIQRHGDNYGKSENGNQLSFKDLEKYVQANGIEMDVRGAIIPRIKELIRLSMLSAGRTMNLNDRKHCFEIFGYDFMIDAEYKVWLIEINTNPCLDESSPLLGQLLPRMLDDAFKLTVDVLFPKPAQKETRSLSPSPISKGKKAADSFSSEESESYVEEAPKENVPPVFSVDGYPDEESMWEYLCCMQPEKTSPKKENNNKEK